MQIEVRWRWLYAGGCLFCGIVAALWAVATGWPGLRLPVWPSFTLAGLAWALAGAGGPSGLKLVGLGCAAIAAAVGLVRLALLWMPAILLRVT